MAAPDKNAIRILVLDDEPLMLEFLADTLGALGYSQVTTCGSGYRALSLIESPGMDIDYDGVPDLCNCATNPSLPVCCPGDLDHDRTVGGADIGLLLSNWGPCGSACLYDINNDSKVNGGDLGLLLSGWGPCPN